MSNPAKWFGLKYPDSDLVGLLYRFARPASPGLRAIDVGCGTGRHIRLLGEIGYAARGIDSDPKMVEMALANGLPAEVADAAAYRPPADIELAVAWGLMMLVPAGPRVVAEWQPRIVIADWRSEGNDCLRWPENEPQADGSVILRRAGHVLDGLRYLFHDLDACHLPGYQRVYWQRVSRTTTDETNEWYQTVHRVLNQEPSK